MSNYHKELATGKWFTFSLAKQMGNIGSEVHRTISWFRKKDDRFQSAFERALELFDLTIADERWKGRLKEICRSREIFCSLLFESDNYKKLDVALDSLDNYFLQFASYSRLQK